MSILAVGSVAFDAVRTPYGQVDEILGGSATYFGLAASQFSEVSLVAVVGEDFPESEVEFLRSRGIDTRGLTKVPGQTFRWKGEYTDDMNAAVTLETHLNVFAEFAPSLIPEHRSPGALFLGNIDPDLQRSVLEQVGRPRVVACDTMNYWITSRLDSLLRTLAMVDILIINDAEAKQLAGETNVVRAARRVLEMGPKTLVIKRGEHGALMMSRDSVFAAPSLPLGNVVDPTGAGDSFAGGFVGYLDSVPELDERELRRAVVYGTVMASFNVCSFGPKALAGLTRDGIDARFAEYLSLVEVEPR